MKKIRNRLLGLICMVPLYAFAFGDSDPLVETQGYWSPIYPGSPYWPFAKVSLPGYGTAEQQENISTNPDAFCASQGEGWRLPSLSDISWAGYQIGPGFAAQKVTQSYTYNFGNSIGFFDRGVGTNQLKNFIHVNAYPAHAAININSIADGNNNQGIALGWRENLHPSNFWDGKNMSDPKLDLSKLVQYGPYIPSSLHVAGTLGELFLGLQREIRNNNGLDLGYGSDIDTTKEIFYTNISQTSTNPLAIFGPPPALYTTVPGQTPLIRYWLAETTSPEMLPPNTPSQFTATPNRAIFYAQSTSNVNSVNYGIKSIAPSETANIMCVRQYYY